MIDWRTLYPQDSDVPFGEWEQAIAREARGYFNRATKLQREARDLTISDQSPYWRSPKAERAIREARRVFRFETEEASQLFEETCLELARDGQVSEEMSSRWDMLCAPVRAIEHEPFPGHSHFGG